MRQSLFSLSILLFSFSLSAQNDSVQIKKIYNYHLTESKSYTNLEVLCKKIGGRLAGSPQAAQSVEWAKKASTLQVPIQFI